MDFKIGTETTGTYEEYVVRTEESARNNPEDIAAQNHAGEQRKHLHGLYSAPARTAFVTRNYERAIRYYRREEELTGTLADHGTVYMAAALIAVGDVAGAKDHLRTAAGQHVTSGLFRSDFSMCRELDPR